jgi:hypothetical protein
MRTTENYFQENLAKKNEFILYASHVLSAIIPFLILTIEQSSSICNMHKDAPQRCTPRPKIQAEAVTALKLFKVAERSGRPASTL